MTTDTQSPPSSLFHSSKTSLWSGRIVSWLTGLFLLLDAVMKLVKPDFIVKATEEAGLSPDTIVPLGVVLTVSSLLYLIPRTSVLGAVLVTGYLGGACATHVVLGDGWFEIFFPVVFGIMAWGGLWFIDRRVRAVLPFIHSSSPENG